MLANCGVCLQKNGATNFSGHAKSGFSVWFSWIVLKMDTTTDWLDVLAVSLRVRRVSKRIFKATIGVKPIILVYIWHKYSLSRYMKCQHLLWALNFIREYSTIDNLCTRWNVSAKTFSKIVWQTLNQLATILNEVHFDDRLSEASLLQLGVYVGAVDATECPVARPKNWRIRRLLYSGKKKTFTVKYESKD